MEGFCDNFYPLTPISASQKEQPRQENHLRKLFKSVMGMLKCSLYN